MKGRGLLIAAAVIQLVGAAFMLLSALSSLVMMPAVLGSLPTSSASASAATVMRVAGLFYLVLAGFTVWVSIKLIQMRKWAWIVSLVMSSLCAAFVLVGALGVLVAGSSMGRHGAGIGFGEAIILFVMATPIFVVIGLLIGGRQAALGNNAPSP